MSSSNACGVATFFLVAAITFGPSATFDRPWVRLALSFLTGYSLGLQTDTKSVRPVEHREANLKFAETFEKLARIVIRNQCVSREELLHLLGKVRDSPRFSNSWRPEYDVLWIACFEPEGDIDPYKLRARCATQRVDIEAVPVNLNSLRLVDLVRNLLTKMRD